RARLRQPGGLAQPRRAARAGRRVGRAVSGGGDDRDERPRLSWSEIDRLRDRPRARRDERTPRGPAATARARAATRQYLASIDEKLFAKGAPGGARGAQLAAAVRAAQGTPGLADACRAYLEALGAP